LNAGAPAAQLVAETPSASGVPRHRLRYYRLRRLFGVTSGALLHSMHAAAVRGRPGVDVPLFDHPPGQGPPAPIVRVDDDELPGALFDDSPAQMDSTAKHDFIEGVVLPGNFRVHGQELPRAEGESEQSADDSIRGA